MEVTNVKEMHVLKRSGISEPVSFDKILNRVKKLGLDHNLNLNYSGLVIKIIDQLHDGISTSKIDELTAEQAASLSTTHPDYGSLASAIVVSNLQKNTTSYFSDAMNNLYNFKDINNNKVPLLSHLFINTVNKHIDYFDNIIDHSRDYLIDYFGFKTLERAYLMHINKKIIERPQYMWLRVAICLHMDDLEKVKTTYDLMSQKYFTHATPTLFNAGTPRPQLSSCFLIAMEDDSVDGIYNTLKECANISKWAGGIGLHIHNVRGTGSHIRGTNGTSNGIIPMLSVFNKTARYIDQGGGKRAGSFAMYIEPHHPDIEDFLDLKKNHGDEELRARDLFYALWISDLFMERVHADSKWSLFCPDRTPGLSDCYGDNYKQLYLEYELNNLFVKQINARDLWIKILDSQMETGTPYMLYKDSVNNKTNQQNLGTIKSSNLCAEIAEYSNENETAVCNLASIGLPKFIKETTNPFNSVQIYSKDNCNWCVLLKGLLKKRNIDFEEVVLSTDEDFLEFKNKYGVETVPQLFDNDILIGGYNNVENILRHKFDYKKLHKVTKIITENLNKIIDVNFYPTEKTKRSNLNHRPIGIGVQGLADVFINMEIPFDSPEAKLLNKEIFAVIYYAASHKSLELAKINGPYETFKGSPLSKGQFQFDLWGTEPITSVNGLELNWKSLGTEIMIHGVYNSLLLAPMPTASTSQIMGYNECFEPYTSFLYTRSTLAGQFEVVNHKLLHDLIGLGLWNKDMKNKMLIDEGSIQNIPEIPDHIKAIYKNSWDLSNKTLIDMSADRGAYVCQSQSLNLSIAEPTFKSLSSMHFYSWKKGLKTGIYYLRTKPKTTAQKFTVEPEKRAPQENALPCDSCSG